MHEPAGGPIKVLVDLFLILLVLAAFALATIFFVRNLNSGNAAVDTSQSTEY